MDTRREMTIEELAKAAGTSVRTIRYYITQGILPGPAGRGKNSVYTADHLLRLKAARSLAENHVPLEEIRRTIPFLARPDLTQLLESSRSQKKAEEQAKSLSPREYVSALLMRSSVKMQQPVFHALVMEETLREPVAEPKATAPPLNQTAWRRYELLPGLEVHVSEDKINKYRPVLDRILKDLGGVYVKK